MKSELKLPGATFLNNFQTEHVHFACKENRETVTTNSYAWFEYANIVFSCVNFTRRQVGEFQKQGYGF